MAGGIEGPGIGPAAAGRRRVVTATITPRPTGGRIAGFSSGMLGGHLGPQEPGQLAGDRDDHHLPDVLAGGQAAEATAQPQLGGPGSGGDLGGQTLLAAAQRQGGRGRGCPGSRRS